MADNEEYKPEDSVDEYQYVDLDTASTDPLDESVLIEDTPKKDVKSMLLEGENIRRNALIAVSMVIGIIIIYKIAMAFFSSPKKVAAGKRAPAVTTAKPRPRPSLPLNKPTVQAVNPAVNVNSIADSLNKRLGDQLSVLAVSQQRLRSEITSVNDQINGMNGNVNDLSSQIIKINEGLSTINTKMDRISHDVENLIVQLRPKPKAKLVKKAIPVKYFVQALIPGRAWLIATNGKTLTVGQGSMIPGYGIVKFIDPAQGRIVTSSGQIIGFNQTDS